MTAIWNWNTFTGLSDDSFLGRSGEFYDCENIDTIDNAGYVDGAKHPQMTKIGTAIGIMTKCSDYGTPAFCNLTSTYFGFGAFNASVSDGGMSGAYLIEQIGTSGLPVTYWFKNGYIRQQVYNGSGYTFNDVITANVPPGIPTASCIGAGRIYFSVLNNIWILDTAATDPTAALSVMKATAANDKIPFGYTIKYMYIYMDVMNVVTTNGVDTVIYQLVETTTDVWGIRYYHKVNGVVCISAAGEGNSIYWISNNAIYQSNGTESQKVKVVGKDELGDTFNTSSICTISEGIFKIAYGNTIYEYGHKKPGYNPILVKKVRSRPVVAMKGRLEVYGESNESYGGRDNVFTTNKFTDYSITSLPYSASDLLVKKEGVSLRVGHLLPAESTYDDSGTSCEIIVKGLTDEMEQLGITTPVIIATITTPVTGVAERYTDIVNSEIINAISTAGYNPDFNYIKFTIEGTKGDILYASDAGVFYGKKTPKFFGLRLIHKDLIEGK